MLAYQHAYHAGNAADVHKHALLAAMLARLTEKPKPLWYCETHAGRGLYALDSPEARKTGEAAQGIDRALAKRWFVPDHPYLRALEAVRAHHGPAAYPGSPLIAAGLLRPADRMLLAELHPAEHTALCTALPPGLAEVVRENGPALALARTPPAPRRGLMLIDPSYELRADYAAMPRLIADLHRRWNVGVLALWYPVLDGPDPPHMPMVAALQGAGYPRSLHSAVRFAPARPGHRMVGSGLFVVNAPFGLSDEAARIEACFAAG